MSKSYLQPKYLLLIDQTWIRYIITVKFVRYDQHCSTAYNLVLFFIFLSFGFFVLFL